VEQRLDNGLVAHAAFLSQLAGSLDVRDGQPDGHVLGGYGAAAAVLQQQIRDQLLMLVPPFRFLGFGPELGVSTTTGLALLAFIASPSPSSSPCAR